MLTWRNIVLLGSFLGVLAPSVVRAQAAQPTSAPTSKPAAATPLFPYGNINPQPQGDPMFPFANPTPANITPPVTDTKERSSLLPGIFYGGAVTFGLAGLVGGAVAINFKSKAKQATTLGPGEIPDQEQASQAKQLISSTRTAALLSDLSFGLSITGALGGYFLSKRAKASAPEATPTKITPY